jgi:hypothetical protein
MVTKSVITVGIKLGKWTSPALAGTEVDIEVVFAQ